MSEAALKRSVVSALKLALGRRGCVLRLNAGRIVLGQGASRRMVAGVEPGTPDLLVLLDHGACVWLELKAPKGRLSPAQVAWHARAAELGHEVYVVRSVEDAVRLVTGRRAA